jgi:CheY-like chemotaxis protein
MATVLVVEDEFLIRSSTIEDLKREGFEVLEASNAAEAIATLETRQDIHLLFTDVDMPGSMDGLKLAAFVRDRWPPVEIIVTSGKTASPDVPERAVFIPKPYRTPHVVKTIRSLTTWGV